MPDKSSDYIRSILPRGSSSILSKVSRGEKLLVTQEFDERETHVLLHFSIRNNKILSSWSNFLLNWKPRENTYNAARVCSSSSLSSRWVKGKERKGKGHTPHLVDKTWARRRLALTRNLYKFEERASCSAVENVVYRFEKKKRMIYLPTLRGIYGNSFATIIMLAKRSWHTMWNP